MHETTPTGVPRIDQTEIDKKFAELADFIKSRGFSADQIRDAYYRVCGVSEDGRSDPATDDLYSRMKELSDGGFPLNRFAVLIEVKQDIEDASATCISYIGTLPVSDNEKWMLRSIVEKRRNGKVSVIIDNEEATSFRVNIADQTPTEAFAFEFQDVLRKIVDSIPPGTQYEFSFSEK